MYLWIDKYRGGYMASYMGLSGLDEDMIFHFLVISLKVCTINMN